MVKYEKVKNSKMIAENLDYGEQFVYYTRPVDVKAVTLTSEERALFEAMRELYWQDKITLVQKKVYDYLGVQETNYIAIGIKKCKTKSRF